MLSIFVRFVTVFSLLGGLAACAVTSSDGTRLRLRSDAFAEYVEAVFRRQNTLSAELAAALDDADPDSDRYLVLEDAELGLLRACVGLNELAERRRAGEGTGGLGALKRARQAPECDRAAQHAAALLL